MGRVDSVATNQVLYTDAGFTHPERWDGNGFEERGGVRILEREQRKRPSPEHTPLPRGSRLSGLALALRSQFPPPGGKKEQQDHVVISSEQVVHQDLLRRWERLERRKIHPKR